MVEGRGSKAGVRSDSDRPRSGWRRRGSQATTMSILEAARGADSLLESARAADAFGQSLRAADAMGLGAGAADIIRQSAAAMRSREAASVDHRRFRALGEPASGDGGAAANHSGDAQPARPTRSSPSSLSWSRSRLRRAPRSGSGCVTRLFMRQAGVPRQLADIASCTHGVDF